jgi:hypothetical protein
VARFKGRSAVPCSLPRDHDVHGELIVVEHLADTGSAGTLRRTIIRVDRADGSATWVISSNNVGLPPTQSLTGTLPPLTVAQLTAIALDPRLTLYPA